ncbi:hypothetical protein SDC9_142503 [bioreactor metagenome]|uniref:Uncharacterized protein n=1 Tax=bioreactor metagenome TaxID=1076179 RepID=A0A645E1C4_9ZZZZ
MHTQIDPAETDQADQGDDQRGYSALHGRLHIGLRDQVNYEAIERGGTHAMTAGETEAAFCDQGGNNRRPGAGIHLLEAEVQCHGDGQV